MRFAIAMLPVTFMAMSAHAMLPTPTETNTETGEISYMANPAANPSAPTMNVPMTSTTERVVTVTPQNIPIQNPLSQPSSNTVQTNHGLTHGASQQVTPMQPNQIITPSATPITPSVSTPTSMTNAPSFSAPMMSAPVTSEPVSFSVNTVSTPSQPMNHVAPQGSSVGIQSVVNAFVVQNVNGQETLIPVTADTTVQAGDILEYQGLFTNNSTERVRTMDVTLSIADGLELIGGVMPRLAQATIDDSRFLRIPIRANVGGQIQELPLSQYKALRWTVEDIGLGGTAVVKYRARVK